MQWVGVRRRCLQPLRPRVTGRELKRAGGSLQHFPSARGPNKVLDGPAETIFKAVFHEPEKCFVFGTALVWNLCSSCAALGFAVDLADLVLSKVGRSFRDGLASLLPTTSVKSPCGIL